VVRAVARAGRTPADRYAVSLAIISSPSGLRGARASSALRLALGLGGRGLWASDLDRIGYICVFFSFSVFLVGMLLCYRLKPKVTGRNKMGKEALQSDSLLFNF
jgi:hypothetical protein